MQNDRFDDLVERLQREIEYCDTCQPYDEGQVVWVLGVESDLEELFDRKRVPEKYRDKIAESLYCPNCGRQFGRYDSYGAKTAYEKDIDRKRDEWRNRYSHVLDEFSEFLEKYPYLGVKHKLGRKIVELMHRFPKTKIKDENWFRARRIGSGHSLVRKDMLPPNPHKALIGEGRYNHFGQSHWYLAQQEIGAAKEILATQPAENLVWLQNVLVQSADAILNVSTTFNEPDPDASIISTGLIYFSSVFTTKVDRDKNWKPEYFVPRFVADAAKLAGFQGIRFTSSHSYSDNLVLFDTEKIKYKFVGHPYIYKLLKEKTRRNRKPLKLNDFLDDLV